MIQALLVIALIALQVSDQTRVLRLVSWSAPAVWAAAWAPALLLWAIFHIWAVRAGRRIDERGDHAAFLRTDAAMLMTRCLGVAWFVFAVTCLGWAEVVRRAVGDLILVDEVIILAPLLTQIIGQWWSMFPLEERIAEARLLRSLDRGEPVHAPPTRAGFVLMCLKFQMLLVLLPIGLAAAWNETLRVAGEHRLWPWWDRAEPWLQWGGLLVLLATAPALLRLVWGAVRIADGPFRRRAVEVCSQHRVRVRGPFLWRTHGVMVNAAILGPVWPWRYLLVTDALLERMTDSQIEGVLAHEVAHVRERHLLWLAVCVVGVVLACGWATTALAFVLHWDPEGDAFGFGASIFTLAAVLHVFGHVSRRFEWQADAFAVKHLSGQSAGVTEEAAGVMGSALANVAYMNGISPRKFTWRHGSIAERERRLAQLVGQPVGGLSIDRKVRLIKWCGLAAAVLGAAPFVWELVWGRAG